MMETNEVYKINGKIVTREEFEEAVKPFESMMPKISCPGVSRGSVPQADYDRLAEKCERLEKERQFLIGALTTIANGNYEIPDVGEDKKCVGCINMPEGLAVAALKRLQGDKP